MVVGGDDGVDLRVVGGVAVKIIVGQLIGGFPGLEAADLLVDVVESSWEELSRSSMVSSYWSWAFSMVSFAFFSERFRSVRSKVAMMSPFFTRSPRWKFTFSTFTEPGTK